MSFGISFSELSTGVQMCMEIVERCRNDEETYMLQLTNDVNGFGHRMSEVLEFFEEIQFHQTSQGSYEDPRIAIWQDSGQLIGNEFFKTLGDCDKFITRYSGRRGAMDIGVYSEMIRRRSTLLQDRIRSHLQKVVLIIDLVNLGLLRDSFGEEVEGSTASSLPNIPLSIRRRFEVALHTNPPAEFVDTRLLPLKEGFDVALELYRKTVGTTNAQQYLDLLKVQYLLQVMKRNMALTRAYGGPVYRLGICEIERRLAEHHRSLVGDAGLSFLESDLLELDSTVFAIWPPLLASFDPNTDEVEVLRAPLTDLAEFYERELIVFQSDRTSFRLVENRVPHDPREGKRQIQQTFDSHVDRLMPVMLVEEGAPCFHLQISNCRGNNRHGYKFRRLEDVVRVQSALTGYSPEPILTDEVTIKFGVCSPLFGVLPRIQRYQGTGRLEIWRPASSNATPHGGPGRGRTEPALLNPWDQSGGRSSLVRYSESGRIVTALDAKHPPVLVIFTRDPTSEKYDIWFVELLRRVTIPELPRTGTQTNTLVLEGKNKSAVACRRLSVSREADWNMSVFSLPRHPHFNDRARVDHLLCDFITLSFSSFDQMASFHERLSRILREHGQIIGESVRSFSNAQLPPSEKNFSRRTSRVQSITIPNR